MSINQLDLGPSFWNAALFLVLFGVAYTLFIGWFRTTGAEDGLVAIEVVFGVLVTVAASSFIIGIQAALIVILLFVASGAPMIVGDLARYTARRRAETAIIAQDLKEQINDNP